MRPPLRRLVPLPLLLALALPLGCVNPFTPATPEQGTGVGVAEDFRTPDDLLTTLQLAVESKSEAGANAWIHAFAESTQAGDRAYRSFYDGGVKLNWQAATSLTAPEPWDITLERSLPSEVFRIRANATYQFQWANDPASQNDDDPSAADTAQFHRHYTLVSTLGNNTEIIAIGYVDFSFQKTNGRWSIYRWHDRVDPTVGVNPAATDERTFSWWRLESLAH